MVAGIFPRNQNAGNRDYYQRRANNIYPKPSHTNLIVALVKFGVRSLFLVFALHDFAEDNQQVEDYEDWQNGLTAS
jgi:hypothetical protein